MPIRDRLLAAVEAKPGITVKELRALAPEKSKSQINNAVAELRKQRRICSDLEENHGPAAIVGLELTAQP